jgi:hypothetical protein
LTGTSALSNAASTEDFTEVSRGLSSMHEVSVQALPRALISGKLDDTLQLLCNVFYKVVNNLLITSDSDCRTLIERANEVRLCTLFDQLFSFDSMLCKAAARNLLMTAIDVCARRLTRTLLKCLDDICFPTVYRHENGKDEHITPLELAVISGDLEVFQLVYTKSKSSPGWRCRQDHELIVFETAVRHSRIQIIRSMFDSGFSFGSRLDTRF